MKLKKEGSKKIRSVMIVTGEQSGDLLGGAILKVWQQKNPKISFCGVGGDAMKPYLKQSFYDINQLATIGILEIIKKYRRLKGYLDHLAAVAVTQKCELVVLIDFPGFNLKLAEKLHAKNIKCVQVVSPQIWAWHYSRIHSMKKNLAAVLCLYDFEPKIYEAVQLPAFFMGHPLKSLIRDFQKKWPAHKLAFQKKINDQKLRRAKGLQIALLPGSRHSEIARNLPVFLELANFLQQQRTFGARPLQFLIPVANEGINAQLSRFDLPANFILLPKQTHEILSIADAGVICSGTATLECALLQMPFLLMYKTSNLTYQIFKRILKIPYIGIVNIIAAKLVTKEFIQKEVKVPAMAAELKRLVDDGEYRRTMIADFKNVAAKLGQGDPPQNAVKILNQYLG